MKDKATPAIKPVKNHKKLNIPVKRQRDNSPFSRYCIASLSPIGEESDVLKSFSSVSGDISSSEEFQISQDHQFDSADYQESDGLVSSIPVHKENKDSFTNKRVVQTRHQSMGVYQKPPNVLNKTTQDETLTEKKKNNIWKKDTVNHKGCRCKRSGCLKKYCECFRVKAMCTDSCGCTGCMNTETTFPYKVF